MSRDKFNITSLEITGDEGRNVSNQFIQQESPGNKLAVLYPGTRYTCDRPLLYFTTELLLSKGYDVLQLWSNYNSPQFKDLSKSDKTIQIIADGQALLESGRQQVLIRSICYVENPLGRSRWLLFSRQSRTSRRS